jgi:hypothetical protein
MNYFLTLLTGWNKLLMTQVVATSYFAEGMKSYSDELFRPLMTASQTFATVEAKRFFQRTPEDNFRIYAKLFKMNYELMTRYTEGTIDTLNKYNEQEFRQFFEAYCATMLDPEDKSLNDFFSRNEETLRRVVADYPKAILEIEPEYGFHFERYPNSLVAQTDRFELRRVVPTEKGVRTDESMKPVLIIPPFVLGANILSFLPGEKKSYAHSFANKGIPTYIRIIKDIHETPALQVMTLEDDAADMRYFCEYLKKRHDQMVTLNGYCQGGYSSLCNILSGELDWVVDALITCVAPMDGTRSKGLGKFLHDLPNHFKDLRYGTKTLANGNKIADGELMGWIYKLKSIENTGPMIAFFKDIMMLSGKDNLKAVINKTIAALNFWLQNERSDLPMSVTEMSFRSYNIPVTSDGTLPVTLFGRKLRFQRIKEKNIKWLLCYGKTDDLVEKEVALAPLDFIDVQVTPFPKGHVAIATSWSHPQSSCALDSVFGEEKYVGPVRFHLDLMKDDQAKDDQAKKAA